MNTIGNTILFLIYGLPVYFFLKYLLKVELTQRKLNKIYGLHSKGMTPEQFMKYRAAQKNAKDDSKFNSEGVYIFYNETNKMFYIGQGIRVHERVSDHISGRGNGDLYADMKYGHEMRISIIPLEEKHGTLNKLERELICELGQHNKLYNKTRGNRG